MMLLILLLLLSLQSSQYKIGYTTKYSNGQYNTSYYVPQEQINEANPPRMYGPKRSPQRPFSGGLLEDLADWWRVNTDSEWPGYVDDDYWGEFLKDYPEYEEEAEEYFINKGENPPWMSPIGDSYSLIIFALLVVIVRKIRIGGIA